MVAIISSQSYFFNSPQDVKVQDTVYKNAWSHDIKEFVDNDGVTKTVNYLDTADSEIASYVENNKIVRSEEYYHFPQRMTLGGKTYSGVFAKTTIPGKYSTYHISDSLCCENSVRVRENGSVLDIGQLRKKVAMRKMKQPFVRVARILH